MAIGCRHRDIASFPVEVYKTQKNPLSACQFLLLNFLSSSQPSYVAVDLVVVKLTVYKRWGFR